MSSQLSYNLAQMDHFRTAGASGAGAYGSLAGTVDVSVDPQIFGQNGGASAVAAALLRVTGSMQREFSRAEELLRDVSRAIDAAQTSITEADEQGKAGLTTTSPQSADGTVGVGSGGSSTSPSGTSNTSGTTSAPAGANPNVGTAPPVTFGTGVKVKLPDGLGTVAAPNEKAAGAVREALTQLGVPYVWADATPGKGFDCSGLTMWAYGKEGVNLPHFAANQDIGERVSQAMLAPGDLVVWDGHVAMYIGAGKVIEAPQTGETVHIVPLYTVNGSDRFEGFYRPTA